MKIFSLIILFALGLNINAQTNNYPNAGDVTIFNYSPNLILQRNTNIGGFTEGVQTKLSDGTDNWFFGALHTGQWIVSKGNYANPLITILHNGNIGIGSTNPEAKLDIADNNQHLSILVNQKLIGIWPPSSEATTMTLQSSGVNAGNLAFATGNSEVMRITPNCSVGIGTTAPDQKLTVKGKIHAEEVIVDLNVPVADYVFAKDYHLMPLHKVEQYVQQNSHLPDIPSASEIKEQGLSMGEMQNKLLKKIEEQTLYIIALNKQIEQLKVQTTKIDLLEKRIKELETK